MYLNAAQTFFVQPQPPMKHLSLVCFFPQSDGGGPLACPRIGSTTEYLLVGITAWGIGCGEEGVPGVYASTMADNRWVSRN